jgi:AraC-like DNA-binding protein
MPARRKTLADLVRDGSFLARRHADLLVTGALVADPLLADLQQRYRAERSELERRQLALWFEKAVRDPRERARHAPVEDELEAEHEGRLRTRAELVMADIAAIAATPPAQLDVEGNRRRSERHRRACFAKDAFVHGIRRTQSEALRPWNVAEIAAHLQVSPSTVRRYLDELGVERPRRSVKARR